MREKLIGVLIACSCVAWITIHGGCRGPQTPITKSPAPDRFHSQVKPLLQQYCFECHGGGNSAGELDLAQFASSGDVMRDTEQWQKVIRYARTQVMPPPEAQRQPTQEEREVLVAALQRELYDPDRPDPGRVTLRRLNRTEYRNTIRDLLGVTIDPALDFPEDDTGYGFDNIADVLTLPPMLMEKYLAATEKSLDEAIPTERIESRERRVSAMQARASFTRRDHGNGWVALGSADEDMLSVRVDVPAPGDYSLRVLAYAKPIDHLKTGTTRPTTAPAGPIKLSLMLGDAVVRDVEVAADAQRPRWYEARIGVTAGRQNFRAAVRRQRGLVNDTMIHKGRIGQEQSGLIFVKEIVIEGPVRGAVRRLAGNHLLGTTQDQAATTLDVPVDADYLLRVQACAEYAGNADAKMELRVDDKPLKVFEVSAPAQFKPSSDEKELTERARRAVPQVYELPASLKSGKRRISVRFLNDAYFPDHEHPNYRDRNLIVHHIEAVELSGDPLSTPMTPPMRRLFAKHAGSSAATANPSPDSSAARALLKEFTLRAWRRPPQPDELDRLMQLYDLANGEGDSFSASVKHAIKGVLLSSSFLFRGMQRIEPNEIASPYPIDDFELASRLSYFLWSSMPDDELLDLAQRGELRRRLDEQVKRMLASPKAQALVQNFIGQWLQFRNLDAAHPDSKQFAKYDDRLREAMKRETQLFFESMLRDDSSLLDILLADYTFLNERLATHYGMKGVSGEEFRRVSLADTSRRGVITHGSVLTLTSNPTRTSPVKRGKWVLENLLGAAPPPPPPDIPPLEGSGQELTGTLRQRMEKHREDSTCASCHAPMDPIGFALENFDAIGRWREKDNDGPVDASATLPDGSAFSGPAELADLLAKTRRNDFFRAAAESALTYALGRGVEPFDQPAVDRIVDDLRKSDGRFSAMIIGVVNSVPFQMRRAENAIDATQSADVGRQ